MQWLDLSLLLQLVACVQIFILIDKLSNDPLDLSERYQIVSLPSQREAATPATSMYNWRERKHISLEVPPPTRHIVSLQFAYTHIFRVPLKKLVGVA